MTKARRSSSEISRRHLLAGAATGLVAGTVPGVAAAFAAPAPDRPAGVELGPDAVAGDGWACAAARDEIRPGFAVNPTGGPDGKPALVIRSDSREGLNGCWTRTFPVAGGKHYRFSALYRAENVAVPRRAVVAKLFWQDAQGRQCPCDVPAVVGSGGTPKIEMDYPEGRSPRPDGWTQIFDTYRAPGEATQVIVQLHLQWAADAQVSWSRVELKEVAPLPPRLVRLATAHLRPWDGTPPSTTPMDNCRRYEPLITDAARQGADLIVLGEVLATAKLDLTRAERAEPIPGPSTDYFGRLAREHDLYIVAGLTEKD